jgi:hypothetical protein
MILLDRHAFNGFTFHFNDVSIFNFLICSWHSNTRALRITVVVPVLLPFAECVSHRAFWVADNGSVYVRGDLRILTLHVSAGAGFVWIPCSRVYRIDCQAILLYMKWQEINTSPFFCLQVIGSHLVLTASKFLCQTPVLCEGKKLCGLNSSRTGSIIARRLFLQI